MLQLTSALGIVAFLGLAWGLSTDRRVINRRLLGWGLGLQLLFGLFVFRSGAGRKVFEVVNDGFVRLFGAAMAGPKFVFGLLAYGPGEKTAEGQASLGFFLAFQALPTIIVFSALIAILYYVGVMQLIIRAFAYVFTKLLRISGAESLCAASNIFVGIESALTIRPHLKDMTRSELCVVLTAGMATVASNVIGAYWFKLHGTFPSIAGHLVSASILSAPAALMASKLLLPETENPKTLGTHVHPHYEKEDSLFVAIINGANSGVQLVFGIAALLIAVVGLLAIINLFVGGIGGLFGGTTPWTLERGLGVVFYPFALLMGVPVGQSVWDGEAAIVSQILGTRLVATEFAAYDMLAAAMHDHLLSMRSATICAYALCGFAHFPSVAIFVGGIAALAPERKKDLAAVAMRALLAATLACLMTGCIAGLFSTNDAAVLFSGTAK